MKYLDLTLPTPEENLACDEVLLDACEDGHHDEILRVWEHTDPFIVLGYSNKARTEANLDAARQANLPVLRRCTGGGAVVQGPGCLNFSLILRIMEDSPLKSIRETNVHIMNRHRDALAALLRAKDEGRREESGKRKAESENGTRSSILGPPSSIVGPPPSTLHAPLSADLSVEAPAKKEALPKVERSTLDAPRSTLLSPVSVRGHSDLTLGDLKFSGNAQRRRRKFLLFHGTFLLGVDIELIEHVLPMPSRQPDYRRDRRHREFLTNLSSIPARRIKEMLQATWHAHEPLREISGDRIRALAANRYATAEWTFKF